MPPTRPSDASRPQPVCRDHRRARSPQSPMTTAPHRGGERHGGRGGERRCDTGDRSKAMPATSSASASSPPRPKTKGSPPLSRTTLFLVRVLEEGVDLGLAFALAGPLAHIDAQRSGRHQLQQRGVHQAVVQSTTSAARERLRAHAPGEQVRGRRGPRPRDRRSWERRRHVGASGPSRRASGRRSSSSRTRARRRPELGGTARRRTA